MCSSDLDKRQILAVYALVLPTPRLKEDEKLWRISPTIFMQQFEGIQDLVFTDRSGAVTPDAYAASDDSCRFIRTSAPGDYDKVCTRLESLARTTKVELIKGEQAQQEIYLLLPYLAVADRTQHSLVE